MVGPVVKDARYWWSANVTRYQRGSAGIADVGAKAILRARGIKYGLSNKTFSPDFVAFVLPQDDFIKNYRLLFDDGVTTSADLTSRLKNLIVASNRTPIDLKLFVIGGGKAVVTSTGAQVVKLWLSDLFGVKHHESDPTGVTRNISNGPLMVIVKKVNPVLTETEIDRFSVDGPGDPEIVSDGLAADQLAKYASKSYQVGPDLKNTTIKFYAEHPVFGPESRKRIFTYVGAPSSVPPGSPVKPSGFGCPICSGKTPTSWTIEVPASLQARASFPVTALSEVLKPGTYTFTRPFVRNSVEACFYYSSSDRSTVSLGKVSDGNSSSNIVGFDFRVFETYFYYRVHFAGTIDCTAQQTLPLETHFIDTTGPESVLATPHFDQ